MRRHSPDLLAVIVVAFLALLAGLAWRGPNPVLTAATLPFALVLPGYALIALVLPNGHLGFPERVVLSLGASIALIALGGLLLHALGVPLDGGSWHILLGGLTLALSGAALWRRARGKLAPLGALAARMTPREAGLFSLGALMIGLALGLGAVGAAPPQDAPFTAFWALSEPLGASPAVRVGLENHEEHSVTYRVAVQAGDRLVAEWPQVSLPAGGQWQAQATVPAGLRGQALDALAFRGDDPGGSPYRRVRVSTASGAQP